MDETLERLGILAGYEQFEAEVQILRRTIAETRETAESADGTVSVTVGGDGRITELWLDPRIYRAPDSAALAEKITDTIRRAVRLAEERVFAAATKFLPEGATLESTDLTFDPILHQLDRR